MKTIFEGFLWAFGITLGLGIISIAISSFTGNSFISNLLYQSSEFTVLSANEYGEIRHTVREVPFESEGMVEHKISGQFTLKNSSQYKAVEVFVSLYNQEGIFLGEYTGGKQYIDKNTDVVQFKIDVWDPYSKNEIADIKFKVGVE